LKKLPMTGTANVIAAMSISGVPPFSGFWSKLIIIIAAVQAGKYGCAFLAVFASVLTLAAVIKAMKYVFFGSLREKWNQVKEVPVLMQISLVVLALICIGGGILALPAFREVFFDQAIKVILEGANYAALVLKGI